ncbi:hypothetical protein F0562_005727 [Nyssa sinensis]|uniref:RRM domain-containing protein n=1 Tax=Nyssa sinensis TaxID=561372 RepID=A0A5J5AJ01_9ASTE|nr:hypothetical protein F0562_005727 [Nyssa sinensis]
MMQQGVEPNNLTFPFAAKACGKLSNLRYSQIIHTHVAKLPFQSDIYVQTALVDMYVKCNGLDYAYDLFVKMPKRDVTSWNSMIVGFAQSGSLDRVSIIFYEMRFDRIRPDSVTIIGLTRSISATKNLKLVSAVHSFGIRIGIAIDVSVANTWIAAYSKCEDLDAAEMVFDGIDAHLRTVISWSSVVAGHAYFRDSFKAINFYRQMLYEGFSPDTSTILSLLSSCVWPETLYQGKVIHSHGIQAGCDLDISVLNTLISMYSKCGDINSARYIFDSMMDKTCVSWTAMIGGYAEKGDLDEALALFHSMAAMGEKPDLVTVLYLISGCGQMGALEIGRWADLYASSNGLKTILVCNALIDMYAKCGSIRDAQEIFCTMHERTIVSWTTMIGGCALNGEFNKALDYFFLMVDLGIKPNRITFLAVLQACTHAGFLEKGWEFFDMMMKVYGIKPGLDHYSCMADLLGRKGKLKEALNFVQNMPIKPDTGIWGALLSACKNHRDVEIGEYVAHQLFELEPRVSAPYVEMANIYASAGRWDGVAAIRTMMKCNQVIKFPGQSLVQVNGKSYAFTVQDRCHPEGLLIYDTLDGLALQLKEEGYLSDVYEFFSKTEEVGKEETQRDGSREEGNTERKLTSCAAMEGEAETCAAAAVAGDIEFYDAISVPVAIALTGHLLLGQPVMVKPSEAEKNLAQSNSSGGGSAGLVGPYRAVDGKLYAGNLHFHMTEFQLKQFTRKGIVVPLHKPQTKVNRSPGSLVAQPPLSRPRNIGALNNFVSKGSFCFLPPEQLIIYQVLAFGTVELVQLPTDSETGHCKGFGFVQAAQSLNGKLEIAGQTIKVSSVTDHVGVQDSGAKTADFVDDDGGGLYCGVSRGAGA